MRKPREATTPRRRTGRPGREAQVAVVGAGMSGVYLGVLLKQAGFDFKIFEKASEVGGVWRENRYPGLTCDVPSRYYSYPFALNPDWTHFKSPYQEIQAYFDGVARNYGLMPHIRFNSEVVRAEFNGQRWHLRTRDGHEMTADFVITACGVLHHPHYPDIKGQESFEGPIFHSARWDQSVALQGKRIGIVGTGSTGVQIVGALADVAEKIVHFQRTPQWIFPLPNWRFSRLTKWAVKRSPILHRASYRFWRSLFSAFTSKFMVERGFWRYVVTRGCQLNLRLGIRDPELRRQLTPDYEPGCKRLVMSTEFYKALRRSNVEVVSGRIDRIEPTGIVDADGALHQVDIIVLATGFQAQAYIRPMDVIGENGVKLDEIWGDVPRAYQTVAIPGFPNFFMMAGPHNPLGNQSVTHTAEVQTDYIMQWLQLYRDGVYDLAAPTPEATKAFNDRIREAYPNETVWASGCSSYYLGKDGLPSVWPWRAERYDEMLAKPNLDDFALQHLSDHKSTAADVAG